MAVDQYGNPVPIGSHLDEYGRVVSNNTPGSANGSAPGAANPVTNGVGQTVTGPYSGFDPSGGAPTGEQAAGARLANPGQILDAGTSHQISTADYYNGTTGRFHPEDPRNYEYGRSATGADEAVKQAQDIGNSAYQTGSNLLTNDLGYAQDARNRVAPVGDFASQNLALSNAQSYGNIAAGFGTQLAGLESTQGPSAAQAQLGMGTNQALASQLALARSGRGFGGGAAAMGQAQSNAAGIQANQANQSAMLRAQEDAAWRSRQAANLANTAGIYGSVGGLQAGVGQQFGQQATTNLQAGLQSQAQNDQTALNYSNAGAAAYGAGVGQNLAGQGLQHNIRQSELSAGEAADDRALRAWAAQNGFDLQQQQRNDQQTAATYSAIGAGLGGVIGFAAGGPAGAGVGAGLGSAAGKGVASA